VQRLRLAKSVQFYGWTVWGGYVKLSLSPLPLGDDRWIWNPTREEEVVIIPELFALGNTGRTVALLHEEHTFNEFEHIAFLHALGLRGVRISLDNGHWPPYMCSAQLWRHVEKVMFPAGTLLPWTTAQAVEERPGSINRCASYTPGESGLAIHAYVSYRSLGKGSCQLVIPDTGPLPAELPDIVSARTLGRPAILRPFLRVAEAVGRWHHEDKVAWMPREPGSDFFVELARHKVLDGCLPSFMAPLGYCLAGSLGYRSSNHDCDLGLMDRMSR
jgi:hypothetical protein